MNPPRHDFFIALNGSDEKMYRYGPGNLQGEPIGRNKPGQTVVVVLPYQADPKRNFGLLHHTDRNRLTVAEPVVRALFDGMTDGVPEVENAAESAFTFVGFDNRFFELAATSDDIGEASDISVEDVISLSFKVS